MSQVHHTVLNRAWCDPFHIVMFSAEAGETVEACLRGVTGLRKEEYFTSPDTHQANCHFGIAIGESSRPSVETQARAEGGAGPKLPPPNKVALGRDRGSPQLTEISITAAVVLAECACAWGLSFLGRENYSFTVEGVNSFNLETSWNYTETAHFSFARLLIWGSLDQ